jgi:nickel/cobalt transporter (NicO) family protein
MQAILIGSILLSIFHALIPSHWMPVIAIGRQEGWSRLKIMRITLITGLAHVCSTLIVGWILAGLGGVLSPRLSAFSHWLAPLLLCAWGGYYVWRHYFHHHFHLHRQSNEWGIIASLTLAMFLSPCLEIEGYFLAAGAFGWTFVGWLSVVYALTTVIGMLIWVRLVLGGLQRIDSHAWDHYAGLITGIVLIGSGVFLLIFE